MGIGEIGPINNFNEYKKTNKSNHIEKNLSSDSVNISKEALDKVERKKIMNIVMNSPDIRIDKINEIKEKLKDPNYINDKIINETANKIIEVFKI